VYGFFGVPAPRPDDAARAVAAVRRAERAVRGLAESSGAALELRAGLARGTALVGEDRGSSPPLCVFGPVVERAEALAGSDLDESGLRADEAIHAATADRSLYLKRCAVDRGCGRIFFIEARGG
jgi:class 3 adenylate cyclase